jgi:hypothetical protein
VEDVKPSIQTDSRAARLAQMAADAETHSSSRLKELEKRRVEEEQREEEDRRVREKYGKVQDTKGAYVREQEKMMMGGIGGMGLGDVLGRRGGKGLLREDM